MAMIQDPWYTYTVSFRDRDNNTAGMSFKIATTALVADVTAAFGTTLAGAIAALSDAVVTGWSLSISARENALATAVESSDVERKGSFSFLDASGFPVIVQLPSIKNILVQDGSQAIDLTNVAVLAFVNLFVTGILGIIRPVSQAGVDVTALKSARKVHRSSARG